MKIAFAAFSILFACAGHLPYIVGVIRRRVHPHPYSWLIWLIVIVTVAFAQWEKGAGIGALPTFFTACLVVVIFILSLKQGFEHVHLVDHVFLIAALLAVVPWIYTKDPTLSVIVMTCIDTIGFLPTMRKAWVQPHTERSIIFAMNVPRHLFGLASLQAYSVATALDPSVMLVANSAMVLIIELRRRIVHSSALASRIRARAAFRRGGR